MTNKTIGFIGGGRVARIILGGFQRAGKMPHQVVVSDTNVEVLNRLQETFPTIHVVPNDNKQPASQALVFLGLHPPALGSLLAEIQPCLSPDAILVSLAPKLSIAKLSEGLGGFSRIARVIPNAPSIINAGYNPVAFSKGLTEAEKAKLCGFLNVLGKCPEVAEENLEAYAILTAMGPTYLWFQLDELEALAQSFGLTRPEVQAGLAEMVVGAVRTMYESGLSANEVMDLIPVRPIGEDEANIKQLYHVKLEALFKKLKG